MVSLAKQAYFHRSHFFFAHNGDGRHHGANEHEHHCHYARYKGVSTLQLRIVQHALLYVDGVR